MRASLAGRRAAPGLTGIPVLLLLVAMLASQVEATVPRTIVQQGRLTLASGAPVNGTVEINFAFYNVPTGGSTLWVESHALVTVTDGIFQETLGIFSPLPSSLFTSGSLYLGMRINNEPELPRVQLHSSAFAMQSAVADTLKAGIRLMRGGQNAYFELSATEGLYLNAANLATGEYVYQAGVSPIAGAGFMTVRDRIGDGSLFLHGGDGTGATITAIGPTQSAVISTGSSGDESVRFPVACISPTEVLGEPGVANATNTGSVTLTGPIESLISRTITPPGNGFILAMAGCYAQASHVNGTNSEMQIGLSDTTNSFGTSQDVNMRVPSTAPSGIYRFPSHMNAVFTAVGGVAKTIHLVAEVVTGTTLAVGDITLTLVYVPTAYGSTSPALTASGGGTPEDTPFRAPSSAELARERVESEDAERTRVQAELARLDAELAELRRQLANDAALAR